jgi:hypothetical protein
VRLVQMSGAGGGAAAAAAPPTTTKEDDPFGCGVDTVALPGQRDKLYLVQDLVSRCGVANAYSLLTRYVPEAERRVVMVGKKTYTAVTRAGAEGVLRKLWAPTVAQAQADVVALAATLRIELEADASSAPGAAGAGGAAAADEDAPWPDESEEPLQFSDDERDADEEQDGWATDEEAGAEEEAERAPRRGYDDRAPPPKPSRAALEKHRRFHEYCLRRAQRAVWRASRAKGSKSLITVDPKRLLLSTATFWKVIARFVPPLSFFVVTPSGRVEVPRVSYLLQDYLARSGMLTPAELPRDELGAPGAGGCLSPDDARAHGHAPGPHAAQPRPRRVAGRCADDRRRERRPRELLRRAQRAGVSGQGAFRPHGGRHDHAAGRRGGGQQD